MEKEVEARHTIKVTITLDVPVGQEGLAAGLMDRLFSEHVSNSEVFRDCGVEFTGWDVQHGEKYERTSWDA